LNPKFSRKIVAGKSEMVGFFNLLKGATIPAHRHVSEQISIVLKGKLTFTINGEELVVKKGEVLVIPSNVEHAAVVIEDATVHDCFTPLREDWLTGQDKYLRDRPN
jgi:quercetin dioxygenase-like cupin family protein